MDPRTRTDESRCRLGPSVDGRYRVEQARRDFADAHRGRRRTVGPAPAPGSGTARAVGFRNVLVHGYAEVDDRLVVEQLYHLDVLESFVSQVTARYL